MNKSTTRNPWAWIPSLYFAEGIPYILVMSLSVIFYKRMGVSNADIALYTSWLYLPWVIKGIWSPVVDVFKTKRWWIVIMQLVIGVGLAGVAFTVPVPDYFQYTLAFFWLLAFSSATHDIAADGFYMIELSEHDQAFYVGIRSTFYRLAMLTGQGLLVLFAGYFESQSGLPTVDVDVHSSLQHELVDFNPNSIEVKTDNNKSYFFTNEDVIIATQNINKESANSILTSIENWNLSHNFYSEESEKTEESESDNLWQKYISKPLARWLKQTFNPDVVTLSKTGNIGYTWFYLSKKPKEGEILVLNFRYLSGNKSISLVRDYRYEFDANNWNVPAFAAFQIDPNLNKTTVSSFRGVSGNIAFAWRKVFGIIAVLFILFLLYHRFILPKPSSDKPNIRKGENIFAEFFKTLLAFFKKKRIGVMLIFLLVYRLGESQLVKLASPFLLDAREVNGLGLTTGDLGLLYGTVGLIALSLGGIIGGLAASKHGLKYWLWWMVLAMNLPNLVYVFLSTTMPSSMWLIGGSIVVEQFGYGFGFTAYMLYMIYISEGEHKTAHFAITTSFMALGMMIPGMISGWLQEIIGYQNFFVWVMICTIPSFIIIPFLKIDSKFGTKVS